MVSDPLAEVLRRLMASCGELPPQPVFASSNIFPTDHALMFADGDQRFCCAHPIFWKRFPEDQLKPADPTAAGLAPLWGIPIVNIDHPAEVATREKVFLAVGKIIGAAHEGLTASRN